MQNIYQAIIQKLALNQNELKGFKTEWIKRIIFETNTVGGLGYILVEVHLPDGHKIPNTISFGQIQTMIEHGHPSFFKIQIRIKVSQDNPPLCGMK